MAALTAMGIVAGLGSAGASAYGASQQGKGGAPNMQAIPAPAYATALQRYIARTLAANATKQAPSVLDFAQTGGADRFKLDATAFTPGEAQDLGFTSQEGKPIPYFDPQQQSRLTPEQMLFIGQNRMRQRSRGQLKGPQSLQERYAMLLANDQKYKDQLAAGGLNPKVRDQLSSKLAANAGDLYTLQQRLYGSRMYAGDPMPGEKGKRDPYSGILGWLPGQAKEQGVANQFFEYLPGQGKDPLSFFGSPF